MNLKSSTIYKFAKMSVTTNTNYPSSVYTEQGLVEVQGGQLGLFENQAVVSSYGATAVALWTLFPDRPTRYFVDASANVGNLTVTLPVISNTNYSDAHPGFIAYIYNNGGSNNLIVKDSTATTTYKTLLPGTYVEIMAYAPANSWIVTINDNTLTAQTLQQTYNISNPATIEINTTNGPLLVYNDNAQDAQPIFQVEGNNGSGSPTDNFFMLR